MLLELRETVVSKNGKELFLFTVCFYGANFFNTYFNLNISYYTYSTNLYIWYQLRYQQLEVQLISVEARGPILSIFFDYYLLITNSLFGMEKL